MPVALVQSLEERSNRRLPVLLEQTGKRLLRSAIHEGEIKMRLKILITILALYILTVGTVATASAQLPGTRMSAQIPFDFIVGDHTFPAGKYELRRLGNDPYLLCIQNIEETRNVMMFNTSLFDDRALIGHSALVFHRYDDIYFLARIVSQYEGMIRELPTSDQERSMERDLVSNKKTRQIESVPLAAN